MNARLVMLSTVDSGVTDSEVFQLALHHAVAELGGLGAVIHLRGPMSALRLVSAAGLPPGLARYWEIVDQEGPMATARAVRSGRGLWVPAGPTEQWPGTGLAAVPVFGTERVVGALTLLTGDRGEPSGEQWDFLRAVAGWVQERMSEAPPPVRPPRGELSGSRLKDALREVRVGSWEWTIQTSELVLDEAAMDIYGIDPSEARAESWMTNVHPDDLPWTLATMEKAIRNISVYEVEYRVRRPDGSFGWTQNRGKVIANEMGEPVRIVGSTWDSSESRSVRDTVSRALKYMSEGFLSVDDHGRIVFANLEAERTLGSPEEVLTGRILWELPAIRQVQGLERLCRKDSSPTPASFDIELPTTGRWYHLRLRPVPDGTTCYLTDITDKRRHDAERQAAAERTASIAKLTAALATATTSSDVAEAAARQIPPAMGAAGLLVQAREGDRMYNVGSVGYPQPFLDQMDGRPLSARTPVSEAMLTGAAVFISSEEEYEARFAAAGDTVSETDMKAWAFVPLTVSGRPLGTCMISFDHPRRLTSEERTLLATVSDLVAQALERARLYDAEHTRAEQLQRGLLPRHLPILPACTAAARYLPAGQNREVGGDWYDVIPLSAGRVALIIGDVMGHGLSQAATMGRLRTAVHTLANLELPPDEILSHLNEIVAGLGEESYATCLYALYDPTTGLCSFAHAGHPPPAVVHPDGTVHFPTLTQDPPLGSAELPFEIVELAVPDGSLLVLYTDGLIESARRDIDDGMAALSQALATAGDKDVDQICQTLMAGLLPSEEHSTEDDAALLVARVHALAPDKMASWPLPEDPRAAAEARKHVRAQLALWDLDDLVATTELLASELVGNVVRHARGPLQLRLLHSADLICEVSDGSLTMPRMRNASETDEGGRGLQLIAALSRRWGTRYTATGKCIWTEQAVTGPHDQPPDADALGLVTPIAWELDEDLDALPFAQGD
ncbi:SpoIIE family protein phosphatase [Streptomyces sp. NBC_00145]|uniref:SpoIIE family protein phosphatase n=1 Tax=Streptomyces sp. NBC_00145 TaxID=2975666 RepID=UPI002E17B41F